jgi:hypothetical protein
MTFDLWQPAIVILFLTHLPSSYLMQRKNKSLTSCCIDRNSG